MSGFGNRAERWFAVACLLVLAAALGLGGWQMQRLAWKRDLITRIETRLAAPAIAVPPSGAVDPAVDYRRIAVSGRYVAGIAYLVGPRSRHGESGFHLLSVLALADGRHLLVNRGWVPAAWRAELAADRAGNGDVAVSGVLRTEFRRGYWTPPYDPARKLWFWYDVAGIATDAGIDLLPAVLELDAAGDQAGPPVPGVTRVDLPNNHLQYALTWFALAGVVVIMYAIYRHRRGRRR